MRRIDLYIDETMYLSLKQLPGSLTEHVPRAIYEYLQKLSSQNVSASKSSAYADKKAGDHNG